MLFFSLTETQIFSTPLPLLPPVSASVPASSRRLQHRPAILLLAQQAQVPYRPGPRRAVPRVRELRLAVRLLQRAGPHGLAVVAHTSASPASRGMM